MTFDEMTGRIRRDRLDDVDDLGDRADVGDGGLVGLPGFGEDDGPDEAELAEAEHLFDSEPQRRAMVVLVGDRPEGDDRTASLMVELLDEAGYRVDAVLTVPSVKREVRKALETGIVGGTDLVVTVGGVGVGPRDCVPEATGKHLDRRLQGIEEALRASALSAGALDAGLSRGLAGVAGSTVIVNLADSRAAVRDGMATLCPLVDHVIDDFGRWRM